MNESSGRVPRHFEVDAERSDLGRLFRLWFFKRSPDGSEVLQPPEFLAARLYRADEAVEVYPTMTLQADAAQSLMDALWRAGLRPNNGEGSGAQATAMKAHLEDMRRLVFERPPKE